MCCQATRRATKLKTHLFIIALATSSDTRARLIRISLRYTLWRICVVRFDIEQPELLTFHWRFLVVVIVQQSNDDVA